MAEYVLNFGKNYPDYKNLIGTVKDTDTVSMGENKARYPYIIKTINTSRVARVVGQDQAILKIEFADLDGYFTIIENLGLTECSVAYGHHTENAKWSDEKTFICDSLLEI